MRVVFAGTPVFSLSSLGALIADPQTEVVAVFTQPDRPAGRGKKISVSPVKQRALSEGIAIFQPQSFNDPAEVETLASMRPDLMVVTAYGLILPSAVLKLPRLGCINVHASLLPRWRGAAPIQRAIEAGDTMTGVTLMQMDQGLDSGAMLNCRQVEITAEDTAGSLHDRLAAQGGVLLSESLADIYAGTINPVAQDEREVTYAAKLHKAEAEINWTEPAVQIARKIRAFNPWPIAYTKCNDIQVRILQAKVQSNDEASTPGTIISADKTGIIAAAGIDAISVQQIQKPGGKPMNVASFLNGMRVEPGMTFG